jgi:hypothetical protein
MAATARQLSPVLHSMKNHLRYGMLCGMKLLTRAFYRHELRWIHDEPANPWGDIRLLALLNHTSLFEWLFLGLAPNPLLRRFAFNAMIPAADVTLNRPGIGPFLKALAPEVLPITRQPDHTWDAVLQGADADKMVVLLPEGRMKRANGLDKHGRPMTVRGGIADLLRSIDNGQMLLAYSGGLHHVQVPDEGLPRPFKTLRIALEMLDIREYLAGRGVNELHPVAFKRSVVADLERRRDHYCPQLAPENRVVSIEPLPEAPPAELTAEPAAEPA